MPATRNKMRKTAAGVAPFSADLDDLVQDAYLKVWRYAADFDPGRASPITWMCAIMRRTVIDALRIKQLKTAELDEAMSIAEDYEIDAFDYELAQSIAAPVIRELATDRQQLLSLAYLDGEKRLALAERFDVPVGTIKTWLRRTLDTVRRDCLAHETARACRAAWLKVS